MTVRKKGRKSTRPKESFELVIPTTTGRDLQNKDRTLDAHVRVETYKQIGTAIYVDLFDSTIADANLAHILSESFAYDDIGAKEATEFLRDDEFQVVLALR